MHIFITTSALEVSAAPPPRLNLRLQHFSGSVDRGDLRRLEDELPAFGMRWNDFAISPSLPGKCDEESTTTTSGGRPNRRHTEPSSSRHACADPTSLPGPCRAAARRSRDMRFLVTRCLSVSPVRAVADDDVLGLQASRPCTSPPHLDLARRDDASGAGKGIDLFFLNSKRPLVLPSTPSVLNFIMVADRVLVVRPLAPTRQRVARLPRKRSEACISAFEGCIRYSRQCAAKSATSPPLRPHAEFCAARIAADIAAWTVPITTDPMPINSSSVFAIPGQCSETRFENSSCCSKAASRLNRALTDPQAFAISWISF